MGVYRIARYLFLIVSIFSLTACEAVLTKQPLGDEVVTLDKEIWQGTWMSDEVVLLTTVLDSEGGLLQAAWVERGPEGARFESFTGSIRQTGDWVFLNLLQEPSEDVDAPMEASDEQPGETVIPEYYWARVDNDGKRTLLWWPDVEQIRKAIEDSKIPGKIKEDNDVSLGTLSHEQLEWINAPESGMLKWAEPAVFIRIGD